jgi:hypothetical protein
MVEVLALFIRARVAELAIFPGLSAGLCEREDHAMAALVVPAVAEYVTPVI